MKNDFTQLLIDIQKKSGITVEKARDIKNLKEEIEAQTNKKIGYNTLRRFFGFLPRTAPSKTTLTMLSNYLGFANYSNYINNKLNFDEWYFQQKLIKIQLNNELDDHVLSFIDIGLTNKNNIVAVANYVGHLIRQNNLSALEYLFSGLAFKNLSDSECLKFSTIVTFNLLTIEKEKALAIYKKLLPITTFRNLVPSYYIDYTNLGGIYFEVLQLIKERSLQSSDIFFASLMMFYKRYYFLENVDDDVNVKGVIEKRGNKTIFSDIKTKVETIKQELITNGAKKEGVEIKLKTYQIVFDALLAITDKTGGKFTILGSYIKFENKNVFAKLNNPPKQTELISIELFNLSNTSFPKGLSLDKDNGNQKVFKVSKEINAEEFNTFITHNFQS